MDSLEKRFAKRAEKERQALLFCVYGGLEDAVGHAGGELRGFSVKLSGEDVLCTLRARFPADDMIAFVGAADIAGVLVKAARDARSDRLRWRSDAYGGKTEGDG